MKLRKAVAAALLLAAATIIAPGAALAFDGPLTYKNQHPLFMYLDAPVLASARPRSSISVNANYSSVYALYDTGSWGASIDTEIFEATFKTRREIPGNAEIGFDVPFARFSAGFMDHPLHSYHSALHAGDYGRAGRPDNSFLYAFSRNGRTIIEGRSGALSIGDVRTSFKKVLYGSPETPGDHPFTLSMEASVELPTGNAKKGFGNGSIDAGAALLADIALTPEIMAYLNLGAIAPGPLKAHETVKLKGYYYAGASLEAVVTGSWSAVLQTHYVTSPLPFTGIGALDRSGVILTVGARFSEKANSLEISFTEDPNTSSAPDFSVTVDLKQRF